MHGLYSISANPPSWGHASIARRAALFCDKLTWAVAVNPIKQSAFTLAEREAMLGHYVRHCAENFGLNNITVQSYSGSTAHFANKIGATVLIRGLRPASGLETEWSMAEANRRCSKPIETLFLSAEAEFSALSSQLIRELAQLKEPLSDYVHPEIESLVSQRLTAHQPQ